jgi:hypothetical protein
LVQVTHTQEGVAAAGTEYDAQQERDLRDELMLDDGSGDPSNESVRLPSATSSSVNNIRSYQNFLALEPVILENLPANKEGVITVEVDKSFKENYGCALILAVDKGSVAHYLQPFLGNRQQKVISVSLKSYKLP